MDRTERPDEQARHFLLADSDTEEGATASAREHVFATTARALHLWNRDRIRALTLLGQAQHTVQDSFSPAHTVRRTESPSCGVLPSDTRASAPPTPESRFVSEEDSGLSIFGVFVLAEPDDYAVLLERMRRDHRASDDSKHRRVTPGSRAWLQRERGDALG